MVRTKKLEGIICAHPHVEDLINVLRVVIENQVDDEGFKADMKYDNQFLASTENMRTTAKKMMYISNFIKTL